MKLFIFFFFFFLEAEKSYLSLFYRGAAPISLLTQTRRIVYPDCYQIHSEHQKQSLKLKLQDGNTRTVREYTESEDGSIDVAGELRNISEVRNEDVACMYERTESQVGQFKRVF